MRIKMLTTMAGPDGVVQEGAVIERGDAAAQELIDGGYAEAVGALPAASAASAPDDDEPADETAALTAPEHATAQPKPKARGRR